MISLNEQQPIFAIINKELISKSTLLLEKLRKISAPMDKISMFELNDGYEPCYLYWITEGQITVTLDDNELFIYENGDIVIPQKVDKDNLNLCYSASTESEAYCLDLEVLFVLLAKEQSLMELWFSINQLYQLQFQIMLSSLTHKEERANPGFGRYKAGQTIIEEGDDADYVYSVIEGTVAAIYGGIEVGEINQDEIFGAIAVLTNQKRTASIVAKTDCTVLMVHKDEFSKMLHSHPSLFLNLLTSLADKIVSLNKKVSAD